MKVISLKHVCALCCVMALTSGCATPQWKIDQANVHMDLGQAYINSGQYNPALKELLEAEKLTPDDPRVHYYLGVSYAGGGMKEKAMEEFRKALVLKPDYSEVHNYMGTIYFNMGLWDKAIDAFGKAAANVIYQTPAVALYNQGKAYQQKGEYRSAMTKYEEALVREPQSPLIPMIEKDMGLINLNEGKVDKAVFHFKISLNLQPQFVEAHYWLGQCYLKQNNRTDAINAFQRAARISPDSEFGLKAKDMLKKIE